MLWKAGCVRDKLAIEPLDGEAGLDLFAWREFPDECFGPLFRRGMPLSEQKKWSCLAVSILIHCALALVFYSVARPHPPAPHNWIEVQLVGSCGNLPGDGAGASKEAAAGADDLLWNAGESEVCPPVVRESVPPPPVETTQVPEERPVHTAEVTKPPAALPVKKQKVVKKAAEIHARHSKKQPAVKPASSDAATASAPCNSPAAGEGPAPGHGTSPGEGAGPLGCGTGAGTGGSQGGGPIEAAFGSAGGPRFLKKVMPVYPTFARRQEMEGAVLLRVTINEEGRVAKVEVLQKAGFGFDEAAVQAIRESTFVPAKRDGRSLSCIALLPVRFQLQSSDME